MLTIYLNLILYYCLVVDVHGVSQQFELTLANLQHQNDHQI